MLGFKSAKTAYAILKGIEAMRMICALQCILLNQASLVKRTSSISCSASKHERSDVSATEPRMVLHARHAPGGPINHFLGR
jgi:hypothetical protein